MGSRLCALCVWLVAQHHFQLYDIHPNFLLALRAIEWELYKDSIFIDFRPCFSSANRAMNPERFFSIIAHFYTSDDGSALRWTSGSYLFLVYIQYILPLTGKTRGRVFISLPYSPLRDKRTVPVSQSLLPKYLSHVGNHGRGYCVSLLDKECKNLRRNRMGY